MHMTSRTAHARKAKSTDNKHAAISGFESGEYPYQTRLSRSKYEAEKKVLQVELLKVQHWVQETGQKYVMLFEGRDAAGKGGTIKRFTEHLNPRAARVVGDWSALKCASCTSRACRARVFVLLTVACRYACNAQSASPDCGRVISALALANINPAAMTDTTIRIQ